jgi:hypothetical protein
MTALTLADWEISQIVAALNPHSDRPEIIYVREPAAQRRLTSASA